MLELNADAGRVVGAKIAADRMVFVVTDFCGNPLSELTLPIRIDRQPVPVIADLIEDGVRRCVVDAGLAMQEIARICLSLPCVIEHRSGIIRSSAIFRDTNVGFADEMSLRLGVPTMVESDAHAVTLAHHWFGRARELDDMVLVSLERNLGLGVLHNGRLFRGAGGLSHNLGDLVLGFGPGDMVRLSARAGEAAILGDSQTDNRFAEAVRLGRGMARARVLIASDDRLTGAAVRAGEAVGLTLANVVTLFAPPMVIVTGSSLQLGACLPGHAARCLCAGDPGIAAGGHRTGVRRTFGFVLGPGGRRSGAARDIRGACRQRRAVARQTELGERHGWTRSA